jgi:hypothetical protein
MIASPYDCNSAKLAYRRTVALAVAISFVAFTDLRSAEADGKQRNHQNSAAQTARPTPDPSAAPPSGAVSAPKAPAQGPGNTASDAASKHPDAWSDAEIADARARCTAILQRIHAVALPHAAIRDGACGAPAPIELISIGQNPEVALSPPAIVRCDLAEQLVNWLENDVQPLARKHFKSEIVRIETMSSYECRNAYGRKTTKLSEHALANALDIGGFITASAANAEVLDDWGKPQREIAEEAAAQKNAAAEAAAKTVEAGGAGNPAQAALPSAVPSTAGAAVAGLVRSTIIDGAPNSTDIPKTSVSDASRLGGPTARPAKMGSTARKTPFFAGAGHPIDNPDPEMKAFLHEAHDAACQIFGTTLGPEANADHRNHFHVDMAPRTFTKICD